MASRLYRFQSAQAVWHAREGAAGDSLCKQRFLASGRARRSALSVSNVQIHAKAYRGQIGKVVGKRRVDLARRDSSSGRHDLFGQMDVKLTATQKPRTRIQVMGPLITPSTEGSPRTHPLQTTDDSEQHPRCRPTFACLACQLRAPGRVLWESVAALRAH